MTDLADRLRALDDDDFAVVVAEAMTARTHGRTHVGEDLAGLLHLGSFSSDVVTQLGDASPHVITVADLDHDGRPGAAVDDVLQQLRIEASVRRRLLSEVTFLDASAVADLLHRRGSNPRDVASSLRRRGTLLGVDVGGRALFPAFQIDALRAQVHHVVRDVNEVLGAVTDPWGVLSWWTSPSPRRHDGASPSDLVGTVESDVVRAYARAVLDD